MANNHLMYYVTYVQESQHKMHVVNINGENVNIKEVAETKHKKRNFEYEQVSVDIEFTVYSYDKPFTTILVAVEAARLVMKQEKQ